MKHRIYKKYRKGKRGGQRYWIGKKLRRRKNYGAVTSIVPKGTLTQLQEISLPSRAVHIEPGLKIEEETQIYSTSQGDKPESQSGFKFIKQKPGKKMELITLPHGRQVIAYEKGKEIASVGELTPKTIQEEEFFEREYPIFMARSMQKLAKEMGVNSIELTKLWIDSGQKGESKEQLLERIKRLRSGG